MPTVNYVVIERKRGRKKKVEFTDPNKDVPIGSIISVQNKNNIRGVRVKPKKTESKTYFLNSVTIIVLLENGKTVNTKISKNGKFQITGCKENHHFIDCLKYIFKHIYNIKKYIGVSIFKMKTEHSLPKIIFNTVMKNIDYKVNFNIQRDKLDTFINNNTEFYSLFEASINTGVNIKMKSDNSHDDFLPCLEFLDLNDSEKYIEKEVSYDEYLSFLDEKEKQKELIKEKYTTILAFSSGALIQSGSGEKNMKSVYYKFYKLMMENRKLIEEKLTV
jgi:hypothetical protein